MRFRHLKGITFALALSFPHFGAAAYALTQEQSQELDALIFRLNSLQKRNASLKAQVTNLESRLLTRWGNEPGLSLWAEIEKRAALIEQGYATYSTIAKANEVNALKKGIDELYASRNIPDYLNKRTELSEKSSLSTQFASTYASLYDVRTTPGGGHSPAVTPPKDLMNMAQSMIYTWVEDYLIHEHDGWGDACRPNCGT